MILSQAYRIALAILIGVFTPFVSVQAQTVKIGVLAPLTGPTASDGEEFVRGVEWAVDEANAKGGVGGYTFEVAPADVKDHSAANVTSAVERLLGTDGVEIILTGYASLSLFEVELMAEAGMPYIPAGPSPSFAGIVAKAPQDYWCCWSYTASFKGYETEVLPMVESLASEGEITLRNRKLAMVSSDNPYSRTISEGMKESFTAAGWEVVVDELVPFSEVSDWRPIIAKIRSADADFIVNADFQPGNSALFLRQFLETPTNSLVFLQYAPSVPEFLELTGAQSTGVIYSLINAPLNSDGWPRGKQLMQAYFDRYGLESGVYGVGLYEMTNMYFKALEQVGDPKNHQAIGQAIGALNLDTAAGHLEFDPATHLAVQSEQHIPVSFWQIWDGKRTLIKPDRYANGAFRLPPWMSR